MAEEKKEEQTTPVRQMTLVCEVCHESGGKFRSLGNDRWVHTPRCAPAEQRKASGFQPFETTHMTRDGSPVRVESMRQLRQLENQCGVQSVAYNMDSSNFER